MNNIKDLVEVTIGQRHDKDEKFITLTLINHINGKIAVVMDSRIIDTMTESEMSKSLSVQNVSSALPPVLIAGLLHAIDKAEALISVLLPFEIMIKHQLSQSTFKAELSFTQFDPEHSGLKTVENMLSLLEQSYNGQYGALLKTDDNDMDPFCITKTPLEDTIQVPGLSRKGALEYLLSDDVINMVLDVIQKKTSNSPVVTRSAELSDFEFASIILVDCTGHGEEQVVTTATIGTNQEAHVIFDSISKKATIINADYFSSHIIGEEPSASNPEAITKALCAFSGLVLGPNLLRDKNTECRLIYQVGELSYQLSISFVDPTKRTLVCDSVEYIKLLKALYQKAESTLNKPHRFEYGGIYISLEANK